MHPLGQLFNQIDHKDLIEYRIYLLPEPSIHEAECFTCIATTEQEALDKAFSAFPDAIIVSVSTD